MRVSKEQAAENRERILKAASRLMRERGISGVGVDALTEAAGMTHGSLYSQFGSKERLVEEAVAHAITTKGQEVPEAFALSDYVSEYLSPAHRDTPGAAAPSRPWVVRCRAKAGACEAFHSRRAGHDRAAERANGLRAEATAARRQGARDRRFPGRGTRARPGCERSQAVGRHSSRDQEQVGGLIADRDQTRSPMTG